MARIPHSKAVSLDYAEFVEQVSVAVQGNLSAAKDDSDVKNIFKSTLSAHTVLNAFSGAGAPLLAAASGISRRCATLVLLRQISLTRVELRRFIECVFLHVYFADHPLEWEIYAADPAKLSEFSRDDPLSTSAHGAPAFYRAYTKQLVARDSTGIGSRRFEVLAGLHGTLSQEVHAGLGAVHSSGSLALSQDRYTAQIATKIREEIEGVLSAGVAIVAVVEPKLLGKLDAVDRAWFDWLVGDEDAKVMRGSSFGIERTWAFERI